MEFITTLKGHSHMVSELVWGPKDSFLASCGIDGGLYQWGTVDWVRLDFGMGSNKYHSMIYNQPTGMLLATGTETL